MKKEYDLVLKSGMFFEWYPQLTGEWEKDKEAWAKIYRKIINQRTKI